MKKFNKLFIADKTKVQLPGEYGYRLVKEVHENRNWIKVEGLVGSFQRSHIISFSNKENVNMFPALEDLYTTDQYGSVYARKSDHNEFIGKLNGRSLKQFIQDQEHRTIYDF
ncbi:MAG: hypothetical protein ACK5NC_11910 [Vibrio sp.]